MMLEDWMVQLKAVGTGGAGKAQGLNSFIHYSNT